MSSQPLTNPISSILFYIFFASASFVCAISECTWIHMCQSKAITSTFKTNGLIIINNPCCSRLVFLLHPVTTLSWINWELCHATPLWKNLITRVMMFKGNQLMMKIQWMWKNENTSACKYTPQTCSSRECHAEMKQTASPTHRKCLIKHLYMHIIQRCKTIFPRWRGFFCRGSSSNSVDTTSEGYSTHAQFIYLGSMKIKRSESRHK